MHGGLDEGVLPTCSSFKTIKAPSLSNIKIGVSSSQNSRMLKSQTTLAPGLLNFLTTSHPTTSSIAPTTDMAELTIAYTFHMDLLAG